MHVRVREFAREHICVYVKRYCTHINALAHTMKKALYILQIAFKLNCTHMKREIVQKVCTSNAIAFVHTHVCIYVYVRERMYLWGGYGW